MIQKLRRRFIAASMLSLAAVLLVILGGVNCMNYHRLMEDSDAILSVLAENGGAFPKADPTDGKKDPGEKPSDAPGGQKPPDTDPLQRHGFSPETPYESRFFSVLLDGDGMVLSTDTGRIAAVDEETAQTYAQAIASAGRTSGTYGRYRFLVSPEAEGDRVIFLDCGRSLTSFRTTLAASVTVSLAGLGAVLVLLIVCSRRIVRPVAESYEKQKRFITDAGHEIKTPLTVIGADADLLELDVGENEWLTDIRRQAARLTGLTNDLIYLSRMDEEQPKLQPIEFPLSDLAEELCQSFQGLALAQKKTLTASIPPVVSCTGDEKAIRQLLSILLDNAVKYAPEGGSIQVALEQKDRGVRLSVSNDTAQPMDKRHLDALFDRFYRTDQSRSSDTGGYGLGLAIARSIVTAHKGKIRAESSDPHRLTILVSLPG